MVEKIVDDFFASWDEGSPSMYSSLNVEQTSHVRESDNGIYSCLTSCDDD